jgi:hypothetical protein
MQQWSAFLVASTTARMKSDIAGGVPTGLANTPTTAPTLTRLTGSWLHAPAALRARAAAQGSRSPLAYSRSRD